MCDLAICVHGCACVCVCVCACVCVCLEGMADTEGRREEDEEVEDEEAEDEEAEDEGEDVVEQGEGVAS